MTQDLDEKIFSLSEKKVTDVGARIKGRYSTDLDILRIHLVLRDLFSFYYQNRKENEKKIEEYNAKIDENRPLSEKTALINNRDRLLNLTSKYSKKVWEKYVDVAKDILTEYFKLSPTNKKKVKVIVIGGKNQAKKSAEEMALKEREGEQLLALIRRFLRLASEYIEIDIVFEPYFRVGCNDCDQGMEEMAIDEESGIYMCLCEKAFGNVYSTDMPHFDPERIEPPNRVSYDDKTNFIRRLKAYQGVQARRLPPDLLPFLDKHMQDKYQLPPAKEIREMPADEYGHRCPQTSVYLLKEALRETNKSIHFQDINAICYELWGWEIPQIGHLIPKILHDYTKTQEIYRESNKTDSSINVELRLYWHLRAAGHNCLLTDFKIPQSRDSRKRNSHIFQKMCEETGLKFYPIM